MQKLPGSNGRGAPFLLLKGMCAQVCRASLAGGLWLYLHSHMMCAASMLQWLVLSLSKQRWWVNIHPCLCTHCAAALDQFKAIWLMHIEYILTVNHLITSSSHTHAPTRACVLPCVSWCCSKVLPRICISFFWLHRRLHLLAGLLEGARILHLDNGRIC